MVDPHHRRLSIVRQCELVQIARSSYYYYDGKGESPLNLQLMRMIDKQLLDKPYYGQRQMAGWFRRQGKNGGRKRVRRLMRKMGLMPIYQAPKTTVPHPEQRVYPYLLRVPGCDHGSGDTGGSVVAVEQHDASGLLCRGAGRSPVGLWQA